MVVFLLLVCHSLFLYVILVQFSVYQDNPSCGYGSAAHLIIFIKLFLAEQISFWTLVLLLEVTQSNTTAFSICITYCLILEQSVTSYQRWWGLFDYSHPIVIVTFNNPASAVHWCPLIITSCVEYYQVLVVLLNL